ncbi:MAG TPA: hypothetical protein VGK59_04005 [Ohtaekwangia sp.]
MNVNKIYYLDPMGCTKTNTLYSLSVILAFITFQSFAQVSAGAPHKLPDDLQTETILFLKYDSVTITTPRPDGMSKTYYQKWTDHNAMVPRHNARLREIAAKYPYKYKIVSMTDKENYRSHGAKYMLWLNTFDAFTIGNSLESQSSVIGESGNNGVHCAAGIPDTQLGIMDLSSDKTYLVDKRISTSYTYRYDKMIPELLKMIEKQFRTARK